MDDCIVADQFQLHGKQCGGGSHCSQFIVPKYVACFRPLTSSGMNCFDNIHWWHCIGHSSDFLGGSNGVEKHCIHWQLEIVLLLNCILSKYSLIWYFRFLFKCLFCVHSTTLDKCCPTTETDWQCIKLFHLVFRVVWSEGARGGEGKQLYVYWLRCTFTFNIN